MRVTESAYLLLYIDTFTVKQRLATNVSCNREPELRLINSSKDVLEYMDALYSKEVKSQNTVKEPFPDNLASLFQRVQNLFTREVARVSKSVDYFKREELVQRFQSIFECETAAEDRLDWLVGGAPTSRGRSAAVPEAGGAGEAIGETLSM